MSDKYAFIAAEKATRNTDGTPRYKVVSMCSWLAVSTSGFYEWCSRPLSATAQRRERLSALIEHIFDEHDGTYGYRRVHAVLARRGHLCDPGRPTPKAAGHRHQSRPDHPAPNGATRNSKWNTLTARSATHPCPNGRPAQALSGPRIHAKVARVRPVAGSRRLGVRRRAP